METHRRNQRLCDVLENLPYRDRRILELRYGLRNEQPQTLDKVGEAVRPHARAHAPGRGGRAAQARARWPTRRRLRDAA